MHPSSRGCALDAVDSDVLHEFTLRVLQKAAASRVNFESRAEHPFLPESPPTLLEMC